MIVSGNSPIIESTKYFLKTGSKFRNGKTEYEVIDQNSEDTLLKRLSDGSYVIAWGLQKDGSWNQGHYYTDLSAAQKDFKKRARSLHESVNDITIDSIKNAKFSSSFMNDRGEVSIDGKSYIKIGNNKWEYHPSNFHAIGGTFSDNDIFNLIKKGKSVEFFNESVEGSEISTIEEASDDKSYVLILNTSGRHLSFDISDSKGRSYYKGMSPNGVYDFITNLYDNFEEDRKKSKNTNEGVTDPVLGRPYKLTNEARQMAEFEFKCSKCGHVFKGKYDYPLPRDCNVAVRCPKCKGAAYITNKKKFKLINEGLNESDDPTYWLCFIGYTYINNKGFIDSSSKESYLSTKEYAVDWGKKSTKRLESKDTTLRYEVFIVPCNSDKREIGKRETIAKKDIVPYKNQGPYLNKIRKKMGLKPIGESVDAYGIKTGKSNASSNSSNSLAEKYIEINDINDADARYHDYLTKHIMGVQKSFDQFIKSNLSDEQVAQCLPLIQSHDQSKYGKSEWDAYLRHFYLNDQDNNRNEFNYALNHHIHHNPHHWQYWVLIDENRFKIKILDIPFKYIIEMLCDWHSFSAKDPKSTAYQWYKDNKDVMMLSPASVEVIEQYLEYLKDPVVLEDES